VFGCVRGYCKCFRCTQCGRKSCKRTHLFWRVKSGKKAREQKQEKMNINEQALHRLAGPSELIRHR
jgi:hypothetical protein